MTVLRSADFFPCGQMSVTIEPRLPQVAFPEHQHDFYEIVIVEQGTGTHVFNGQPYTLSSGSICFIRDHDHHLYEHTENLCLTNVLYRAPDAFHFLSGLEKFLPQERDGVYPAHWRVTSPVLQQIKQLIEKLEQAPAVTPIDQANREILFAQLLLALQKAKQPGSDQADKLNQIMHWLEGHFTQEVCWDSLAETFDLPLRTLHRQLKQQTGMTPHRYLNRLRLIKAQHLLKQSDLTITDIAFQCGFSDSNHFSTLFKREFACSPREARR